MGTKRPTGLTLFVQRGQEAHRYLCAAAKQDALQIAAFGAVDAESSLAGIVDQLTERKLKPKSLVLLLPRAEFDVNIYQIPQVEENEIPDLISNLVAESHETTNFTTDYLLNSKDETGSQNALTWTLPDSLLSDLKADARHHGQNLNAITSHTMGSISLWRNLVKKKSPHAVVVTIANKAIDFSVIYNHEVTHVRSIPFASSEDEQIIPRLISELQRTVAITGGNDESDSTRIYLFGCAEKRKGIAEALTAEFEVPVSILNPLDHASFTSEILTVEDSEPYAQLIGAARATFYDQLDVDLISPRRPEQKTLPWRKIAWYAIAASVVFGLGGFLLWDDARKQSEEIVEKRKQFDELARDARRVIEMKDELAAIRAWRRNEVVWLDEIDELSQKLPPREQSLIRRISMVSANDGSSKIDLSVEVSENQLVAGLEDAIRSENKQVKSKRVSESSAKSGEKWNFETSIQFAAKPPKLSFIKSDNPEQEDKNDGKQEELIPVSNKVASQDAVESSKTKKQEASK